MRYSKYFGCENVAFIYFNEWADPKIEYKGFQWSSWMIEDALYDEFMQSGTPYTDDAFAEYVRFRVEEYLKDCLYGMGTIDVEFIKENAPGWFEYLRDDIAYGDDENGEWHGWRRVSDAEVLEHFAGIDFVVEDFENLSA